MNLEKMSKPELQDQHAKLFGATPSGLSKAELIEAIEVRHKSDAEALKASDEVFPGNLEFVGDDKIERGTVGNDSIAVTVTEDILKDNPDLVNAGVTVGEVIGVPVDDLKLTENEMEIVKVDDLGNVIDRMKTTKDAWNLLPGHKYGWMKAAPKEIQ